MVLINRCCCWRSLRRGSFASGIFTLVKYIILFTASVFNVYYVVENTEKLHEVCFEDYIKILFMSEMTTKEQKDQIRTLGSPRLKPHHTSHLLTLHLLTFSIFMLILSFFSVVSSAVLLIGLCVDNRLLLLPWIGSVSLSTLLDFGLSIYLSPDVIEKPSVGIFFATDLIFCALNIYCIICVVSQYQEYVAGRGRAGQTANSQMVPTVRFQPSYGPTQSKNIPSVSFQVAHNGLYSSGLLMVPSPNSSSLSKSPRPTDLSSISEEQTSSNEISRKMSTDDTSANDDEPSCTKSPSLILPRKTQDGNSDEERPQALGIHRDSSLSSSASNLLVPSPLPVKHINVQIVISDIQNNSRKHDELRDSDGNTFLKEHTKEHR